MENYWEVKHNDGVCCSCGHGFKLGVSIGDPDTGDGAEVCYPCVKEMDVSLAVIDAGVQAATRLHPNKMPTR